MKLSTGILAGRHSDGLNDARVRAGNRSVIKKLTAELSPLGEVVISAADRKDYEDLAERVFADSSPLEGIYNIVKAAGTEWVLICGADVPMVSRELAEYMAGYISADYDCVCLTDEKHVHPLCALYSKAMLPLIEEALQRGDFKLVALLRRARTKYVDLRYTIFDRRVVRNVNVRRVAQSEKPPVVFCVCGAKDVGKTGLIVRLINEFIAAGYSVGAIKHDGHDHFAEVPGTDSARFAEAGAGIWAVFSAERFAAGGRRPAGPEEMLELCRGLDVVIFEGLKYSDYPKVEVTRRGSPPLADPETLICIAADEPSPINSEIPTFARDDAEGIFSCVKKYFGL